MTSGHTVSGRLDAIASQQGMATALFWHDEPLDYAALATKSRRLASGLAAAGLHRGDRVAIWMPNRPEWLLTALACWRLGAAIVVTNVRASASEVADLLERSEAVALVCAPGSADSRFSDNLRTLAAAPVGACRLFVGVGDLYGARGPGGSKTATFEDLLRSDTLDVDLCRPDDLALLFATSGSTGRPKLPAHSQAGLADHAQDVVRRFQLDTPGSVQLLPVPLAGAYGVLQAVASLLSGNPIVMMDAFEPVAAASLIRRHSVTGFAAFDELIDQLLAVDTSERPFPSLKWCGFGIFNPGLTNFVENAERRGIRLIGMYGSSETQALFATQKLDASPEERHMDGGWPIAENAQFRVRDIDTGELLGPGRTGEIEISGPNIFAHYVGDDAANAAQRCPDGFFRTGDSGHIAHNGSLVFEARMQDVLRLSGYLVAARDIEAVVGRLPGVAHCQVVGLRTPKGLRPVAFVVPASPTAPLDGEALRQACAARLAVHKVPVAFHPLLELPMTGSVNAPKVNKRRLTEMAEELVAATAPRHELRPKYASTLGSNRAGKETV